MRFWRTFSNKVTTARAAGVGDSLAAWLRETLAAIPPGPVEVETNLGGLDEAASPNPDYDWVGVVAGEFPHLEVRVTYQAPSTRQEAIAPYEVRVRSGTSMRRAWVEPGDPGRWTVLEEWPGPQARLRTLAPLGYIGKLPAGGMSIEYASRGVFTELN